MVRLNPVHSQFLYDFMLLYFGRVNLGRIQNNFESRHPNGRKCLYRQESQLGADSDLVATQLSPSRAPDATHILHRVGADLGGIWVASGWQLPKGRHPRQMPIPIRVCWDLGGDSPQKRTRSILGRSCITDTMVESYFSWIAGSVLTFNYIHLRLNRCKFSEYLSFISSQRALKSIIHSDFEPIMKGQRRHEGRLLPACERDLWDHGDSRRPYFVPISPARSSSPSPARG